MTRILLFGYEGSLLWGKTYVWPIRSELLALMSFHSGTPCLFLRQINQVCSWEKNSVHLLALLLVALYIPKLEDLAIAAQGEVPVTGFCLVGIKVCGARRTLSVP